MMCLLRKFLNLSTCELSLFSIKLSELFGYFYYLWEAKSISKEIQAFEVAIWCLADQ